MAELVEWVKTLLRAMPEQPNGQVRSVPDVRTIRYYAAIGLLEKPAAMKGRTALYSRRHVAQILAIKRFQAVGRSLAEIQEMWPRLDDDALKKITGVDLPPRPKARREFWRDTPAPTPVSVETPAQAVEVRIQLGRNVSLHVEVPAGGVALSSADVDALRAAAAPLIDALADRQLTVKTQQEKTR